MTVTTEMNRFPRGTLVTVRPSAGTEGPCLIVEGSDDHGRGRLWHPLTGRLDGALPFDVDFGSLPTPDGEWIIDLDDGGGSEVGGLVAHRTDGSRTIDLTPGRAPFVLRGLETTPDGRTVLATIVDDDGHHLYVIPFEDPSSARTILTSEEEAWFGHLSADGAYVSTDSIEHNPGVRRPAVLVFDAQTGERVAMADDLPDGPIRAVRFSPLPGDPRILLSTERTGYARPAIWDPLTGERIDFELPEITGEILVLDWHPSTNAILGVDTSDGIHRLIVIDDRTGEVEVIRDDSGSYAEPDVADVFAYYWQSFFIADGSIAVLTTDWTTPMRLERQTSTGIESVITPPEVPPGQPLESMFVRSADGTDVQLWWAAPKDQQAQGTILYIHGGPNLASINCYQGQMQSWLAKGFAVAALNYRGSVTFGRSMREGFWGGAGDREIEDVAAAISWLRGRGLADPSSTFITGHSYGGHMSLLSVGRLPGTFAGALAVVAMADWEAAWAEMNPALRKTWTSFLSMDTNGNFDPARIEPAVKHFSAINYVEDVTASVWLFQGNRDTRTPPEQARSYAERLRAVGGDVLLDWFDAGHEATGGDQPRIEFERMFELVSARLAGTPWQSLPPM